MSASTDQLFDSQLAPLLVGNSFLPIILFMQYFMNQNPLGKLNKCEMVSHMHHVPKEAATVAP